MISFASVMIEIPQETLFSLAGVVVVGVCGYAFKKFVEINKELRKKTENEITKELRNISTKLEYMYKDLETIKLNQNTIQHDMDSLKKEVQNIKNHINLV
jgi:peptidoglycan hydrolase CwlO-like protein